MRVLLITHEASLSGAPRIAHLVARALTARGHKVAILSRRPGPLIADFRAVAPTSLEFLYRVRRRLWLVSGLAWLALAVDTALATLTVLRHRPDLVYINSTSAAVYMRPSLWLRRRVVVHTHESTEVASRFLAPAKALSLLHRGRLVACSPAAARSLAELAQVPLSDVAMLASVPDAARVRELAGAAPDRVFADDEIVIGCCGGVEQRKGTDLWLAAARMVRAALPGVPLRFVWVGEIVDPSLVGPDPDGIFVGPSANPYAQMKRFDIATMPSRDDPFPLVVLESMVLGTPVVAFAVGGVPEQIGDAGVIVPAQDVSAFAEAIVSLVVDEQRRLDLGRRALERAKSLYSVDGFVDALIHQVVEPRMHAG